MKTTLRLCGLPLDTLLDIFHAADGIDVISLRQTCKILHSIEKEFHENIWRYHLDRHCMESGVFLPSLHWASSSLDGELVLRRAEMMRTILKNRQTSFLEKPINSIATALKVTAENVHCASLLPGGRFLVLISQETLRLWDLESCPSDDIAAPRLLLDQHIPGCTSAEVFKSPSMVSSTAVGVVLRHHASGRAAALQESQYVESRRYCQLHFNGSDGSPPVTLQRIHAIRIALALSDSIVTEARSDNSLCLVFRSDVVFLWNFVAGTYATWTIPNARLIDRAFILNTHVFFSCSRTNQISRFTIPFLHPPPKENIVNLSPVTTQLDPVSVQLPKILDAGSIEPGHWDSLPWGEISTLNGSITPVQSRYNEGTGLFCSEWRCLPTGDVQSMASSHARRFNHRFPLNKIWYMDSGTQRVGSSRCVITCGLWGAWSGALGFYAALSQFPTTPAQPRRPGADGYQVPLLAFSRQVPMVWDFCPLSGKLAIFFTRDGKFCVYDFVGPHLSPVAAGKRLE